MDIHSLAKQFVDLCNQGKNFDVMETLYAPDIVSVEEGGQETAGQQPVIEKSRKWAANVTIHSETVKGPYFNSVNGDSGQFAVHFTFEVTPKSTGQKVTQQEIGVYTVKNGKISREVFYNQGNW